MSGFAPRCAGCGAWRRARGLGGGEATPWRRGVTFILAIAAVTIAFVDVQQSRRVGWLGGVPQGDAPAAAPVVPATRAASTPESPAINSSGAALQRPVSVTRLPGGASAPSGTPRTAPAPAGAMAGGAGAATTSGTPVQSQSSISSTIVDWFQRVRFGRGDVPSVPRDTIDSTAAALAHRVRNEAPQRALQGNANALGAPRTH